MAEIKVKKGSSGGEKGKRTLPLVLLLVFLVLFLLFTGLSIGVLNVPPVPAAFIAVLETVLISLLKKVPVFVHCLVIAGQILCGFLFGKPIFMVFMCLIYLAALFFLLYVRSLDHD